MSIFVGFNVRNGEHWLWLIAAVVAALLTPLTIVSGAWLAAIVMWTGVGDLYPDEMAWARLQKTLTSRADQQAQEDR